MKTMIINNTNNNSLWRERQEKIVRPKGDKKSKLSKLQTEFLITTTITTYINNYCAQNNTLRAKGIYCINNEDNSLVKDN